ncbi:MAG: hypothetical protein GF408_08025 [Candidatus Omnitrophica bacterium]|nr:hypothetical protein [Candidatus Omnitrophota bacterium]
MIKKLAIIFLIAAVAVVVFAKDKLIELSVEKICTDITGARFDIREMKVDLLKPVVDIKDLIVYNPEGFPGVAMAEIPEVYVSIDLKRSLGGEILLRELRFNLRELNVVKNAEGEVNLETLNPLKDRRKGDDAEKTGNIPQVKIRLLVLKAGQVHFRDYSKGVAPSVHTFTIGLDETYRDIDDIYTLIRLVISRAIKGTMVSNLIRLPMDEVNKVVKGTYDALGTATDTTTGVLKGTEKTLADTVGKVGDLFTGVLGGGERTEKE